MFAAIDEGFDVGAVPPNSKKGDDDAKYKQWLVPSSIG